MMGREERVGSRRRWSASLVTMLAIRLSLPAATFAEDAPPAPPSGRTFSSGYRFVEMSGEELFSNVCQGCHMAGAIGAVGAGSYPSLAGNRNLESSGYPIYVVVNGRRGMPPFGEMMSDDQIAAVVNYLRTHFGNSYEDRVTANDVKAARR
jgi:mono/diheme cytochrome c family protein